MRYSWPILSTCKQYVDNGKKGYAACGVRVQQKKQEVISLLKKKKTAEVPAPAPAFTNQGQQVLRDEKKGREKYCCTAKNPENVCRFVVPIVSFHPPRAAVRTSVQCNSEFLYFNRAQNGYGWRLFHSLYIMLTQHIKLGIPVRFWYDGILILYVCVVYVESTYNNELIPSFSPWSS